MMAVSNEAMIAKMIQELQQAKQQTTKQDTMKQHLSHVRLLCDLILQEDTPAIAATSKSEISEAEMKAMLGSAQPNQVKEQQQIGKQSINHEEANGSSIFDF